MLNPCSKLIDGHCHLASLKATPREFFSGIASNMASAARARGNAIPKDAFVKILESQQDDDDGDQLVQAHRDANIDSSCLLAPDFSFAFGKTPTYEAVIAEHIAVCKRHEGHFRLFAGIDPRWGKSAYLYFESVVKLGIVSGLKLYPPCGFSMSDPICFPLYEICGAYNIPVLYHSGPTSPTLSFRYCDAFDIDDASMQFKNVNFIAAHGAINLWQDHILLAKYRPNIYLDISGFLGFSTGPCWKEHLSHVFSCGVNHKIIFGTDWPVFRSKGNFASVMQEIFTYRSTNYKVVGQTDSENILYKNMEHLLCR